MQTTVHTSGSIVIHGAILLGFVGMTLVSVEPLGEPVLKRLPVDPLVVSRLEGPPAAAPPPRAAGGTPSPPDALILETPSGGAQPRESMPIDIPATVMGDAGTLGVAGGHPEGVDGGLPGGIPGGDFRGVVGGILDGVPGGPGGSPLDGLPAGDRPVHLTGAIRPPERIAFVKPEYPESARLSRTEGKVILEIVVGRTGSIEEVTILRSHPLFDQAAAAAVLKWKYRPALQAGLPVKVYLTVVVSFELQ